MIVWYCQVRGDGDDGLVLHEGTKENYGKREKNMVWQTAWGGRESRRVKREGSRGLVLPERDIER